MRVLALIALAACGGSEPEPEPVDLLTELSEPGPYSAGYRTSEVRWTDPVAGERVLRLALWYPTDQSEGPAFKYQDLFEAPGAVLDAPLSKGSFPVAVFSHGHLAYAEAASFLPVHLASHGFVVAAPDHTDNTTFDGPERQTAIYWQRPGDISAVIDHLEDPPSADPLAGRTDLDGLMAFGHSFGGYTLFALAGAEYDLDAIDAMCTADPDDPICSDWAADRDRFQPGFGDARIAGFSAMASGDYDKFGAAGVGAVERPVLTLTGGLDTGANNDEYWDALVGADHRRVHITTAAHNTFSDFSGILDQHPDLIDPQEGFRTVRVYTLAWARMLGGDAAVEPVLNGEIEVHSDVVLSGP